MSTEECGCYACIGGKPAHPNREDSWLTIGMTRMIVCSECGNKRCPHATDHRNECTGSNEPGQLGIRYGMLASGQFPKLAEFLASLSEPRKDAEALGDASGPRDAPGGHSAPFSGVPEGEGNHSDVIPGGESS